MIPYAWYYGGQQFIVPGSLPLAPMINDNQFLSVSRPIVTINSSNLLTPNIEKQQRQFQQFLKQHQVKEEKGSFGQVSQKQERNQEKSVKRVQNPHRNIFTNITNLVLNFMICRKKVGDLLQMIDPSLVQDKLFKFYKYVKDLKSYFCSYFNINKVKKLFHGVSVPHYNKEFHKTLRIAARIILEQKIPICMMTSKKLSPELRFEHLGARRAILSILKASNKGSNPY